MAKGRFITLEGGEGAGKSTLQAALAEHLKAQGLEVVITREPGGTPLAEAVRSLALHPPEGDAWTPLAEALLMNAARKDHLDKLIRPALTRGAWVICDRFSDSTRAYQSAGGGVKLAVLKSMETQVLGDTRPDLTIILDAPPEDLLARRDGETDAFEARGVMFHRAVRRAFLRVADEEPERCLVVNALLSPGRVLKDCVEAIEARLPVELEPQ